jgi:psp operon transcriptional activator
MSRELGRENFAGFSAGAAAALQDYAWPGNVRELRNVVERAVCRALDRPGQAERPIDAIAFDAFASPFRPPSAPAPAAPAAATDAPADFPSRIRRYEESLLREALAACRFNQRRTAEQLGLSYDQLRHYLKKHGIAARPT